MNNEIDTTFRFLPRVVFLSEIGGCEFEKVRLQPRLYGLKNADIKMPTSLGTLTVTLREGSEPKIECNGATVTETGDGGYMLFKGDSIKCADKGR